MKAKGVVITSLIVILIILSAANNLFVTPRSLHLKSIKMISVRFSSMAHYETRDPIHIRSNADFALFGATGVGTNSDPYRFENLTITSDISCIVVEDTTAHFVISNCRLETSGVLEAILFTNVENGIVDNCEIANSKYGIRVSESFHIDIVNTIIYNSTYGIHFISVLNSTITDCTTFYNQNGIVLERTNYNSIRDNTIYANWGFGIEIGFYSHNNSIYGNSIGWNGVTNDDRHNAIDSGEENYFHDNISVGNYWSDFNESESYVIIGSANSIDPFAQLLEDNVAPIIVPQYDTAFDIDSVGNSLTWLAYDVFPKSYVVHEGGVDQIISVWTGGDITVGLDHLEAGNHRIIITIYDGEGNHASDEVFVSAVSFLLGGIGTELVMIASGITVVCFVIIVIIIKRLS